MIKVILFDLDGVLVDACEIHYESLNEAIYSICHFKINREDHIKKYNGLPTKVKLKTLQNENLITDIEAEKIWKLKQNLTIDTIKKIIKPDVNKIKMHEFIKSLDVESVCVTNSIRETATLMLDCSDQLKYMKFIVCNEDVSKQKPDPEPYLFAMEKLKISPVNTLIIEDSEKGYESALASKANVIKVTGYVDVNEELIKKCIK